MTFALDLKKSWLIFCSLGAFFTAFIAYAGWRLQESLLTSWDPHLKQMSPASIELLWIMAAILLVNAFFKQPVIALFNRLLILLIPLQFFSALTKQFFDFQIPGMGVLSVLPGLGNHSQPMSMFSILEFLMLGVVLTIVTFGRGWKTPRVRLTVDYLGVSCFVIALLNVAVALFRVPLFVSVSNMFMSLPSSLAFLFLSVGLLSLEGFEFPLMRKMLLSLWHGKQLFNFLPLIVLMIFAEGWLHVRLFTQVSNPTESALLHGLVVLLILTVLLVLTYRANELGKMELVQAAEREQRRIYQELHDGLGQEMTGISLLCKAAETKLLQEGSAALDDLREINRLIVDSIGQLKQIIKGIFPENVLAAGLDNGLQDLAEEIQRQFRIACEYTCSQAGLVTDTATAVQLYFIAKEAVHNAVKHASARHIQIRLALQKPGLVLSIRDDGVGMGASEGDQGLGLKIMRFRSGMLGAEFKISPANPGTLITCLVPAKIFPVQPIQPNRRKK